MIAWLLNIRYKIYVLIQEYYNFKNGLKAVKPCQNCKKKCVFNMENTHQATQFLCYDCFEMINKLENQ